MSFCQNLCAELKSRRLFIISNINKIKSKIGFFLFKPSSYALFPDFHLSSLPKGPKAKSKYLRTELFMAFLRGTSVIFLNSTIANKTEQKNQWQLNWHMAAKFSELNFIEFIHFLFYLFILLIFLFFCLFRFVVDSTKIINK